MIDRSLTSHCGSSRLTGPEQGAGSSLPRGITQAPGPASLDDRSLTSHTARRQQTPACDRCTQGVMDATNDHLWGRCDCDCHRPLAEPDQGWTQEGGAGAATTRTPVETEQSDAGGSGQRPGIPMLERLPSGSASGCGRVIDRSLSSPSGRGVL